MGERHHVYIWYDDSSKQSGGGPASISQTHLGSDVLTRICSEKKEALAGSWRSVGAPAVGIVMGDGWSPRVK